MTQITEAVPQSGVDSNLDFDTNTGLLITSFVSKFNGNIDAGNFSTSEQQALGLTSTTGVGANTRRSNDLVATTETTTSNTFTNLATVGPTVTLTLEPRVICIVVVQADIRVSAGAGSAQLTVWINGAEPVFGAYNFPTFQALTAQSGGTATTSNSFLITMPSHDAVSPASYVFQMKYNRTGTATAEFSNRYMGVITLKI